MRAALRHLLVPGLRLGTHCDGGSASCREYRTQRLYGSAFPGGAWERGRATAIALVIALGLLPAQLHAQAPRITPPKEQFGFNIGDDYCLANYKQLTAYWEKLEKESDRIKVVRIGTTEEGRAQLMA